MFVTLNQNIDIRYENIRNTIFSTHRIRYHDTKNLFISHRIFQPIFLYIGTGVIRLFIILPKQKNEIECSPIQTLLFLFCLNEPYNIFLWIH